MDVPLCFFSQEVGREDDLRDILRRGTEGERFHPLIVVKFEHPTDRYVGRGSMLRMFVICNMKMSRNKFLNMFDFSD